LDRRDVVIVGGGHNGLVAAVLLARSGRSVLVLERRNEVGGAAASERVFPGVDARLSRFAYLVSLFPHALMADLGLKLELRRRPAPVYPPEWHHLRKRLARVGERVFPTLTEPLRSRDQLRRLVADDEMWDALFEQPLSVLLERSIADDRVRGETLTDATIGTFAAADDPELRQNRCFLYHVIGNGSGDWDVPVGGMGSLSKALRRAARRAGAVIRCGAEATSIFTDGEAAEVSCADGSAYECDDVLAAIAPAVLARLLGEPPSGPDPEGSQLKLNMVLSRLPRLHDGARAEDAFAGTFHANEGYAQLARAYDEAASGQIPTVPPCEVYCHSLTDPSILSDELRRSEAHTMTLFGLHMPARLFASDHDAAKARAVEATLASLGSVLAEPIEDCLMLDGDGRPCLEAHTPLEIEAELGMPGGHIFHRDLTWPFAESDEDVGRWGVETAHANVWLCGAGARRGGAVSGIPGHNAARAVLEARSQNAAWSAGVSAA
jgi:phytoene dehydrogenase-like protein